MGDFNIDDTKLNFISDSFKVDIQQVRIVTVSRP
jgi:hypothetical protein